MAVNVKLLRARLRTILANTVRGFPDPDKHGAIKVFGGRDMTLRIGVPGHPPIALRADEAAMPEDTLAVVDDGFFALEDFVSECNKDQVIRDSIGRAAVDGEVARLVRSLRAATPGDAEVEKEIRAALERLRSLSREWAFYLPVENLVLKEVQHLDLGPVSLVPTDRVRSDLKRQVFDILSTGTSPPAVRDRSKALFDDHISHHFPAQGTTAVVRVTADATGLRDAAVRRCEGALSILRGFTHVLYPPGQRRFFALGGWLVKGTEASVRVAVDQSEAGFNKSAVGAMYPYEVTPRVVNVLREFCALDSFDAILTKPPSERSQIEQTIVEACQWHGAAVNAATDAQAFVWHTIALERLLICPDERATTGWFPERLAWLLGQKTDQRTQLESRGQRLYRVRSEIVHAGMTSVSGEHLAEVDALASAALIRMVRVAARWSRQREFKEWVRRQRMGGDAH
jgi:hypothetical protein